ncbi:hypothetical protein BI49514_03037 [Brevibacterium iodinum ATCC 49514]|uniref:Uncharacterized protein n=1 Tax=Brevibacterium iodinum ATCC 49514 TaxID=1255616 RepID=A0A2H1KGR8_9MICO|nr:hypothetical protein [Brevibacterium iodinum]SMX98930.1 hypothetical protein BI49514_03037 [Brevibacterium iodinum ATCC 49514]SUW14464.1 Uncharacterised protein [Brevibacterium iodinum]
MRNVRVLLGGVAVFATAITVSVMLLWGSGWAVVAGTIGVLATLLVATYIVLKSIQTALQRLSGIANRQSTMQQTQLELHSVVKSQNSLDNPEGQVALSLEARRAIEDLQLASRSLTVPQAHFEQLLRTISANTVRTETALDQATEALLNELRESRTSENNRADIQQEQSR